MSTPDAAKMQLFAAWGWRPHFSWDKKEALKPWIFQGYRASFFGASNVTRTHDLLITNQLLYRLSYTSKLM